MDNRFKELQTVFYADTENNKVVEALWWNWSTRCSTVELDVININLSLKNAIEGHRAEEEDLMRVDTRKLFETKEEAQQSLNKLKETQ